MRTLYQDIRFGIRMLVKNPGFALPAILCLGLGIGACTAVLSVVNAVLVRPLPYTNPERLVAIDECSLESGGTMDLSHRLVLDMRQQSRSFEEIGFTNSSTFHLTGGEFPERIGVSRVSTNLFKVLDAEPFLGRTFLPGEDQPGKSDVVVMSHGLWQRRFGSDPNLVGETITCTDMQPRFTEWIGDDIKSKVYTVVGIMPPRFLPPRPVGECNMWVPQVFRPGESNDRSLRVLKGVSRLKAGVTQKQAQAAEWKDIQQFVLRKGAILTGIGLVLGMGLSCVPLWILTRLVPMVRLVDEHYVYGVHMWDPLTYICIALIVFVIMLAACWFPARRATKIDPMSAIRYE